MDITLTFLLNSSVSNEDSEMSDSRGYYGDRRGYHGGNRDRRRHGDEDDTVLDSQEVSSVTSQDQGNVSHDLHHSQSYKLHKLLSSTNHSFYGSHVIKDNQLLYHLLTGRLPTSISVNHISFSITSPSLWMS